MGQDPPHQSSLSGRPRWLPVLAALAGIALTAAAGNWQLNRAHEKERLEQQYERGVAAPALRLGAAPSNAGDLRMRRIEAQGEFIPNGLILLDNKTRNGVPGYEVLMPLRIDGSSMHVLVNRGWIAAGPDRAHLPAIKTPPRSVNVIGTAVVPGRFLELSKAREVGPVWQNLTIERYVARTGLQVEPIIVQQQNEMDDGLLRAWPAPEFGIARHYGYALQWFSLCALIIFLYVYFHVKRSRLKKNPEDAAHSRGN